MDTVSRRVVELDRADRTVLERVLGRPLSDAQEIVFQVHGPTVPEASASTGELPEWCNVYDGLSADEVESLSRSIVRLHGAREFG